jgi:hypothetical protein
VGDAGPCGEDTLQTFSFGGRIIESVEMLGARLAPDHRYFKVRGDDGACEILHNGIAIAR